MKDYQSITDFIRNLYPNRDFIPLHEPYFGGNEKKYVLDCIDSTFVSSVGKYVDRFEEMICDFTGAKYAIATVNGTAALHIALLLAGVQPDDLVITQPLTFVATCNAIKYCGADPVFVDIDRETLGLSPESLEKWLSGNVEIVENRLEGLESLGSLDGLGSNKHKKEPHKTKHSKQRSDKHSKLYLCVEKTTKRKITACVPIHTFGHPCRIDRIVDICNKYHIPVVEDSAESIGSYYKGQHTGTFGKLGILSFNGNKTITTGGGGMIITNDEQLAKKAKHITTTAKIPHPWEYQHDMIGYNYRLPNINAALGCAQMELLPEIINNKRLTADTYKEYFLKLDNIEFISEPINSISNYWLNAILLPGKEQRDEFLNFTNDNKVMTRPAWTLMNKLEPFKNSLQSDLSVAEDVGERLANIPSSKRKI